MSKPHQAVVVVPSGQSVFELDDVARLLAEARFPGGQMTPYVSDLGLLPPCGRQPRALSRPELDTMNSLWRSQGLKVPALPIPEQEWPRYLHTFNQSPERPAGQLVPQWGDGASTLALWRQGARNDYRAAIHHAIAAGIIVPRDPVTQMAITAGDGRRVDGRWLLSRDDVIRLARDALMEVRDGSEHVPHAVPSSSHLEAHPAGTGDHADIAYVPRQDAIGWEIDAAIERIVTRDQRATIDKHVVMAELAMRAGMNGSCIDSLAKGAGAVIWRDEANRVHKLTKDALRKRLWRRTQVQAAP